MKLSAPPVLTAGRQDQAACAVAPLKMNGIGESRDIKGETPGIRPLSAADCLPAYTLFHPFIGEISASKGQ